MTFLQRFTVFLFLLVAQAGAQVNLSSSLTACYALDASANEPINNLQGTVVTGVTPTFDRNGVSSSAMVFPGIAGKVIRLPNSPLLKPASEISISGWFQLPSLQWMIAIFAKNTSTSYFTAYSITTQMIGNSYYFRCYRQNGMADNVLTSTTSVLPNVWYHLVFCISNNNMHLYINGMLEATMVNTITSFNFDPSRDVILGGTNESNFDRPYSGRIDNLRFYNRILNSAEVLALYQTDPICLVKEPPVTTAISVHHGDHSFGIAPNPFTDYLEVEGISDETELQLLDISGRTIPCSQTNNHLAVPTLAPGIYFLKISSKEKSLIRKVIRL